MKSNTIKKITIVIICSVFMYLSGVKMLKMSGVHSFLDGIFVMVFFICLFPFLILSLSLLLKAIKYLVKSAFQTD